MSKFRKYLPLAVSIGIAWGAAGLSYLLTGRSNMEGYAALNQPPLAPPGWLFPVAWTILYILMGISSYLVLVSGRPRETIHNALILYAIQLFFNFLWPIVFFRFEAFLPAFGVLIALWVGVVATMWQFYKSDERAGDLMIPYLLWVTFAGYLNLGVYLLNG